MAPVPGPGQCRRTGVAVRPRRLFRALALACLALAAAGGCDRGPAVATGGGARTIGHRGRTPGNFNAPRGIDVSAAGLVAVADRTGRIQLLDADGKPLREWLLPKYDNGTPTGITFDATDPATTTLLVADTHNSRILRYDLDGRLVGQFGQYGEGEGRMIYPTDIALAPDGTMFIAEYGKTDRILVYTRGGEYLRQFGSFGEAPGQLQRPMGIVWHPGGWLVVADACNHRVQLFTPEGELLAVWGGETGAGAGRFDYPYDVAIDEAGLTWVAEWGNNRLQALDAEGRCVRVIGGAGSEPGRFAQPWGVATGNGLLWVADTLNHRLQALANRPPGVATARAAGDRREGGAARDGV